jgi:RNA polymerase sigma-70 factor (ECF subfamily)
MDRITFDRVLRDQRHRVYSHAMQCLRDPDDAADVTQEAFLRLWRQGPEVDDERLAAWLVRVVHNLCIDHARRRQTVRKRLGRPDPTALGELRAGDGTADPGDPLDDRRESLRAALETLPAETRSIMLLHYYQGLKLREIAELLGKNVNSLKVRIHRARKALREVLDEAAADTAPTARRESAP